MNPQKAKSMIVAGAALSLVLVFLNAASAQDSVVDLLRRELGEMRQQVKKLVERIEQLEREKTAAPAQQTPPEEGVATAAPAAAGAKGAASAFNPAISVNALFSGGYSTNPKATRRLTGLDFQNGFNFQEAEIQFTADVDPYWKANLIFSVNRAGDAGLEEGYFTSEELPYDLLPRNTTLKLGKFYASFGKHNLLHAHQFPFIDRPLVSQAVFGDEGLKEPGAGLSYLLPTSWFSELTFQGMAGENEGMFRFKGDSKPRGAYLGHWKNFFDLSDETTLEIGNSYIGGRNSAARRPWSHAAGLDLTIKWRPLQRSTERALIWQTEYIYFNQDRGRSGSSQGGGLYSSLQYQFSRRWWLQGRYDLVGIPNFQGERKHRWTTLLAFVPSEFSAIRLQHSYTAQDRGGPLNQVLLQFNFTIGSHPAHQY